MEAAETDGDQAKNKAGLSNAAVTGIDLAQAGSAEVVEIENINVDPDYQRDLRWDLVNTIARDYDIVKAGPILLSEREDGTLWNVDGQHRMAGAAQAGETEMFAHVVHGLTREEEAELRLARNNRRSDTIQEKFKTRLVMNDPVAHEIVKVVERFGAEINLSPVTSKGINAIGTLELLYKLDSTGVWLDRTLNFVTDCWLRPDHVITPEIAGTNSLKASCWFIGQHIVTREASWDESVERFSSYDVEDISRKAAAHKAALGAAMWINWYRALVELWNWKRTEARKLKWKTTGSITRLGEAGVRTTGWDSKASR
jgi:hypothetical protein